MINEHDRVILTDVVPDYGLLAGDVGTVVHVYQDNKAFEVEFVTLSGQTVAVITLEAAQVRPVGKGELAHARAMR